MGDAAHQSGQSLRVRSNGRASPRTALKSHRAGQGEPLSQPFGGRKSGSVRPHEGRRIPGCLAHSPREDRHGVEEPQYAGPDHVPHLARRASSHRKTMVHLSDVRLCARAIEFDRLNLTYTMMSKRKLLMLVQEKYVNGWDDPRMPTISGMRRRGYTPEALRNFCGRLGVSKTNGTTELSLLEYCVREDLNRRALRVMAVLNPLRVVIDNYPDGVVEEMEAVNNPEDPGDGARHVPFSKVLYIEQDDFREDPPKQFYRLSPGREVRLRYGYFITCTGVVKNAQGEVVEVHCSYDPETRGGNSPPDGRKVKSTIHWVSAEHAINAEVRLYETLFTKENPNDVAEGHEFTDNLNPQSTTTLTACKLEPSLANAAPVARYQFERLGYFCVDRDSTPQNPVFNRTVTLKDTWAKIEKKK